MQKQHCQTWIDNFQFLLQRGMKFITYRYPKLRNKTNEGWVIQIEMESEMSAVDILDRALTLMRDEMEHAEDSLSLAMYEYACTCSNDMMNHFNSIGEKKWSDLIEYGIKRGEFNEVDVNGIVNVILYAYQGVRMWSRIVSMTPEVFDGIINHIRKQLVKE